jgi:hypothetical protein
MIFCRSRANRVAMGPLGYLLVLFFSNLNPKKSAASNPGRVSLSRAKVRELAPRLYVSPGRIGSWISWLFGMMLTRRAALKMHMRYGDARAAVCVSVKPLIVAAYSDDFDGVVLLQFPQALAERYKLKAGSTLITVNTYDLDGKGRGDIVRASAQETPFVDFMPVIADFVTDDRERIAELKKTISKQEWTRCYQIGARAMKQPKTLFRDGVAQLDEDSELSDDELNEKLPKWMRPESADERADREEWRKKMGLNWAGGLACFIGTLAVGVIGWYAAFHAPPSSKEGGKMRVVLLLVEWLRAKGGQALVIGVIGAIVLFFLLTTWAVLTNRVTDDS